MEERYKRLLSLEGPMWSEGSPVIIEKGALLSDDVRNQNLLQLKLRNIQAKPVKAVVLDIGLSDVKNDALGKIQYSYLDLAAGNGDAFGDDIPIWLDDNNARGFRFYAASVVFLDGSTWGEGAGMNEAPDAHALAELGDLRDQYIREVAGLDSNVVPQVMPTDLDGLWYCTCGALNAESNVGCCSCGLGHDIQRAVADVGHLQQQQARHREEQQLLTGEARRREAEEAATRALGAARAKKAALVVTAAILAVAAVVSLVVFVVVPEQERRTQEAETAAKYDAAVAALETGDVESAAADFAELADYRDSAELLNKARAQIEYAEGTAALDAGDYTAAVNHLKECIDLGGFSDAENQLTVAQTAEDELLAANRRESGYSTAVASMSTSFKKAERLFRDLPPGYKDSAVYLATIDKYSYLMGKYSDPSGGEFDTAEVDLFLTPDGHLGAHITTLVDDERVELVPAGGWAHNADGLAYIWWVDGTTLTHTMDGAPQYQDRWTKVE